MNDPVLVSVAVESKSTAWSLGRTLVERGWASSVEVAGPVGRIDQAHDLSQVREVYRLSCRTVADRCKDVEALARLVVNRPWVEVTITSLRFEPGDQPIDE
ncbi:hypothetical protein [Kribbella sp. NPDC006257]|uniref:hypothetical protein n=1 Tax=Kribbella sp. NPDC006257 TaxID=3156738 RepID=UPI00339F1DC8